MSDKPWDADAELGSGRTLDFGGKAEDLGGSTLQLPDRTPEVAAEAAPPAERRRHGPSVRPSWIIWVVILFALAGPLFGVVAAIITAIDDISESSEFFDESSDLPTASENIGFLRTLDASVTGTAQSLPQCFFDEAATDLCTSTYAALSDLISSTSATADCSGFRAFWIDALNSAAEGRSLDLEAIYSDNSPTFPPGYADARTRCLGGD